MCKYAGWMSCSSKQLLNIKFIIIFILFKLEFSNFKKTKGFQFIVIFLIIITLKNSPFFKIKNTIFELWVKLIKKDKKNNSIFLSQIIYKNTSKLN